MATNVFHIFKVSDQDLISSFQKIAKACNTENVQIILTLAKQHNQTIQGPLSTIKDNEIVKSVLSAKSSIFWRMQMNLQDLGVNLVVERVAGNDQTTINFADGIDPKIVAPVIAACYKHFKAYERTEATDKLLGNELAEFYRRREQGLLRLEELTQKLTEQNEDYRRNLDIEKDDFRKEMKVELKSELDKLHKDYEENEINLKAREDHLEDRVRDLDDRDSRHARRQIHKDFKGNLKERGKEFTLTKKTNQKRLPVHVLFILLIIIPGAILIRSLIGISITTTSSDSWFMLLRIPFSAAAMAAAVIFYIRWNDNWFRQHADEEFRLKRLDLDIDRASWVVEMALEWKEEKGTEIPEELIDRLSLNLFSDSNDSETVKHPSEDLASALLSASSGLTIKIPGVGEAILDRKAIKKFKTQSAQQGDVSQ